MEATVGIERSEERSDCIGGEKRPPVEDGDVSKEVKDLQPALKRVKGSSADGDVKKVAEMVLVLAAMGKMRGGKGPTVAEKDLMAEARSKLAKMCEDFAPKDVFPMDGFERVIEDLGLNKLKEQRGAGFRPPKLSIADNLLVSKRKMETAEDFSRPSVPNPSPRLQVTSVAAGPSPPVQMSHLAKPNHMPVPHGNLNSPSNATSLPYQLPSSEIRPMASAAYPTSHLAPAALPRGDRPHVRSDGRSNGLVHPQQVQANYSVNSTTRTPTWSVQPQTVQPAKIGPDGKVPVNMSLKVEAIADTKSGLPTQTSRTLGTQTTRAWPQGTNNVQSSERSVHAEIGKVVQKLLKPQISERPTWNPPSRDYMNRAIACQMCATAANEIDTVLICDACEKGYHIKCLQTSNQRVVLRGEWHCGKCLSLSNGKPIPPKYGRVMRNTGNPAAVLSAPSKKVGGSDEKVNQPKPSVIGNSSLPNISTEVEGSISSNQVPLLKKEGGIATQENDKTEDKIAAGTVDDSSSVSPANSTVEKRSDEKETKLSGSSSGDLEVIPGSPAKPGSAEDGKSRPVNYVESKLENHVQVEDSKESQGSANREKEQEATNNNPVEITGPHSLHTVNWVGDPIRTLDDKTYYASCRINGHLYENVDHALMRSENGQLIPSKLQAMWEDKNTAMKWVTAKRCYFPGDFPGAVGHPCSLESSEVFESASDTIFLAGFVESPCKVLPPRKFAEETEKRARTNEQLDDSLTPIYLCKWIYDEAKGLFRDVSC